MVATDPWDVTLNGRGYMLDLAPDLFRHESVSMIRQQSDTADRPGEGSLNPAGLWRRSQESWHHGAGQEWLDRQESNPFRFDTSKGVNVWDKYGLTLLPATTQIRATTNTNLYLTVGSARLYVTHGQTIDVSNVNDTSIWTAATGLPAKDITSITSDGRNVYVSFSSAGTGGIYTSTGHIFTSYTTGDVSFVRYAKGRLMAAVNNSIFNVTAAGALPTALFIHPNPLFLWTDMASAYEYIYASGYAGDKSLIYRIGIRPDGTALDEPIHAADLPDGEIVASITGYLGYIIIGTSKGIRFAAVGESGDLTLGALIPTPNEVACAEGQDRFVWYGLTNYDGTSTGLGRLDLRTFTSDLTPAYASDLMVTSTARVSSVATLNEKRVFAVQGLGVYQEATTTVASGTLTTGQIAYGIPDSKAAIKVRTHHDPLPAAASVALSLSTNMAAGVALGTSQLDGSFVSADADFDLTPPPVGGAFELTATLAGAVTLRRITLLVDPSSERTEFIRAPILLYDTVTRGSVEKAVDVAAEYDALMTLFRTRPVVTYAEGDKSWSVVLDDFQWVPDQPTSKPGYWTGTFVATLKAVA